MSTRTFTIESSETNVTGGRFTGTAPYNVAVKAARKLFKDSNVSPKKKMLRFAVRETTRGSTKAVYHYIGERVTLPTPKVFVRGDTTITVTHSYSVKSCESS